MKHTDLETSRKLQPIMGEKDEGFFWERQASIKSPHDWGRWELRYMNDLATNGQFCYTEVSPCYDLQDLLERLPNKIDTKDAGYSLILDMASKHIGYECQDQDGSIQLLNDEYGYFRWGTTIIQALADLLIWLDEQGYLKEGKV